MRRSLHFLLFAARDSWAGRSLHQNTSSLALCRTCSSRAAELPVRGFAFLCNLISRGESICSCYNLLSPPVYLPSPPISPSQLLHSVLSFCALCLSLPCSRSLPNSKAFLKCHASLHLARLSFQTLAGSFAALTCSFPQLWIPAAWMCLCLRPCTFKKGKKWSKLYILYLYVDGKIIFYAKEKRRLETNDTCMIKWKLKPCLNDYFTQKRV